MRTALFNADEGMAFIHPVEDYSLFGWAELGTIKLEDYGRLILIGSRSLDQPSSLTKEVCARLWSFAERGGVIYAEMVEAFDFPSSRLFGWKQDFPSSRRTIEKLRSVKALSGLAEGALLEWSGGMMRGFTFDTDIMLTLGVYQETHISPGYGENEIPGLMLRRLGEGMVVYAAFSLFGCPLAETLRPYGSWTSFIQELADLTGIPLHMWPAVIRLEQGRDSGRAVDNSVEWFLRSGMLPSRDGSQGVYENIHSVTAVLSPDRRPDCHAHTALMLYLYGTWKKEPGWISASEGLFQHLFDNGYQDMDPESASYGFFKWYDFPGEYPVQLFTDDNAWVCFVLLYLYRRTGSKHYLERGMLVAEGLLATQGPKGLRPKMLTRGQLEELGREGAAQLEPCYNPHFESITHAAFIQAYLVTGREEYLETAIKGTKTLLAMWDELDFMYSRTSGLTRLLLPLGFLTKYDPGGEIEAGLRRIIDYLDSHQHACGGIEEADNPDPGRFGLEDAGVYIYNGEGIADQLYTNNFLVMNSWEAWKATGRASDRKLHGEVAGFMRSIQIRSGDKRYNGGWMRAFDMEKGEYFGNNGDTGWGPYCMESGWTNAITSAGLLLELLDESLFE